MRGLVASILALVALATTSHVLAEDQTHKDTFQAANRHYALAEYDIALRLYKRLADVNEVENPVLFLNLGNAYYRKDQLGKAIHAYRRGVRFGTQDARILESLKENLEVTRAQLSDRYRSGGENRQFIFEDATGMLYRFTHIIERGLLTTLFLVFWCMLCCTLILRRLRPSLKGLGVSAVTLGLPSLLFGLMLAGQVLSANQGQLGIVVAPEIRLQEAPHQEAQGDPIPEGMEVRALPFPQE